VYTVTTEYTIITNEYPSGMIPFDFLTVISFKYIRVKSGGTISGGKSFTQFDMWYRYA
jgi:hypothetical protein